MTSHKSIVVEKISDVFKSRAVSRAVTGIALILIWFPLVVPCILSALYFFVNGKFMLDILMPGELFLLTLIGSSIMIWISRKSGIFKDLLFSYILMIGFLVLSQLVAVYTGISHGEDDVRVRSFMLVLILYSTFVAFQIVFGYKSVIYAVKNQKN